MTDEIEQASQTAYMVTSGEYSDYRVAGVFSTREKAQAWIGTPRVTAPARILEDGTVQPYREPAYAIEEVGFDLEAGALPQHGTFVASAVLHRGATLEQTTRSAYVEWDEDGTPGPATVTPHPGGYMIVGRGETREHAACSLREMARAIVAGTVVLPGPEKTTWPI